MEKKPEAATWYVTFRPRGKNYLERRTVECVTEGEARDVIRTEWPDAEIKDVGRGSYTYCTRGYRESWKRHGIIHMVFHEFCRRFVEGKKNPPAWRQIKAKDDRCGNEWWGLMCAIERWAEKNAKRLVRVVGADDDLHMSSDLVLIPHETEDEYWGTTVVFVEQTKEPREFFLYPGHLDELLAALQDIQKRQRAKKIHEMLRDSVEEIRRACDRDKPLRLREFKTLDYTLWEAGGRDSGPFVKWDAEAERSAREKTPPTW